MATPATSQTLTVGGRRIKVSNLDKVMYPATGTTKRDVLEYLAAVSGPLIRHAAGRPVTRKRWVDGVGTADDPGKVFFQKDLDRSTPEWVRRFEITHSDHVNTYPLADDLATLVWFGQIAALELHVPQWQFGPRGGIRRPDRLVLDLDPGPGVGLAGCAEVARLCREILDDLGLDPVPVTSGSKGIHLYARLDGEHTSHQASAVAKELARSLEADRPDLVISSMRRSERRGKVFIDWSQNNGNKTTIAPYSLRGRPTPTVAAPRTWAELDGDLAQLQYREVMRRVAEGPDPLAVLAPADLPEEADAGDQRDRLDLYRSRRDPDRTPEPVPSSSAPASRPAATEQPSFVIQEHHARALHWDFRLEHDGVLVSWALPKGVPTDPRKNRLAVQTEDHPLEYGTFEGEIPRGEYGGGSVTIWDSGEYELEKWRNGEEVIATLHGRRDGGLGGSARFALIHTGSGGDRNWLIHRMQLPDTPDSGSAEPETRGDHGPMLATLGTSADVGDPEDWAFEMKWDGLRVLAHVDGAGVRLVSRNGNDLTANYPELRDLPGMLRSESAVLDGELVAMRNGRPDFGLLQTRMQLTATAEIERARRSTPVRFMVFDLLELDGRSLLNTGWQRRRELLEQTIHPAESEASVQVPAVFDGDLQAAIDTSAELGLEGVVAKTRTGRYRAGRRGRTWIKIKHHRTQEVVVIGWREGRGSRSGGIGSLLLAVVGDDSELHYVGRVGTGFSSAELDDVATELRALERKTSPAEVPRADTEQVHWVTPSRVAEVEFAEWTEQGRLRQPVWRGWRPDKDPGHVVREG